MANECTGQLFPPTQADVFLPRHASGSGEELAVCERM